MLLALYIGLGGAAAQCLTVPPQLPLGCKDAASAHHPTSPWQNEDGRAVRCHGLVLGYRGFVEVSVLKLPSGTKALGTAQVLMRAVTL